jgi:methionyl aminopeptidase|tara:strand:- start:429 stop:1172 length:744 start_codon:yes stop_codon:yes gene_type:complete
MIHIRSPKEVDIMRKAGKVVKDTLCMLEEYIIPGVETIELDRLAEDFIRSQGAIPGFKGLYGFPSTLCISVEDEVVHGIPGKRVLREGEIVGLDVGSIVDGYYGDHARSFAVGEIDEVHKKLLSVTKDSLMKGIEQARPGNRIGDIGYAIQLYAESHGYGVVTELVGHGIGTKLHEEPQIPNYGQKGSGPKIKVGMCFAIEPMINMGTPEVFTKSDKWTICTVDGLPSAHFEHSITITENGAEILTK